MSGGDGVDGSLVGLATRREARREKSGRNFWMAPATHQTQSNDIARPNSCPQALPKARFADRARQRRHRPRFDSAFSISRIFKKEGRQMKPARPGTYRVSGRRGRQRLLGRDRLKRRRGRVPPRHRDIIILLADRIFCFLLILSTQKQGDFPDGRFGTRHHQHGDRHAG